MTFSRAFSKPTRVFRPPLARLAVSTYIQAGFGTGLENVYTYPLVNPSNAELRLEDGVDLLGIE